MCLCNNYRQIRQIVTGTLLIVLCMFQGSYAVENSVQLEVTGEAVGSDLESPRELCERAKTDAQRVAIEQAVGTFVSSQALISNGQLADDLVLARVRGAIDQMEVVKQERGNVDYSCRVRIKATVRPVYPAVQDAILIKAALSRSSLKVGDEVSATIQVNRDSYLYIFIVSADNSVIQLLPNSELTVNTTRAGLSYLFPPVESSIRLNATLLPQFFKTGASEKMKIIATSRPEPLLKNGFQEGFAVYDAHSTGLVSDLLRRLNQLDPAEWGELTLEYKIIP